MKGRLKFWLHRLREKLWVRPMVFVILSIAGAFLAKIADRSNLAQFVPEITPESIETLLSIMASSMLVIATFAVASMVSAYASAANSGTPRSFPLMISDDVSKNALSVFIGAFIFSVVSLVSLKNSYFESAGRFALFLLTLGAFAWVILTFVRWVDAIARLGRLGSTIDKIESAAWTALDSRRCDPHLRGVPPDTSKDRGTPFYGDKIGYVQHVDTTALQKCAEKWSLRITVDALPGAFATLNKPLGHWAETDGENEDIEPARFVSAFEIGDDRVYEGDPRFGLIALAEIAGRALSPAVNDPGTAIDIVGTFVRIFTAWSKPLEVNGAETATLDRVQVPPLSVDDMFDDAFTAIARDGAGIIEVQLRLQKALSSLASIDNDSISVAARRHSRMALARARQALKIPEELDVLSAVAEWSADSQ